MSYKKSCNKMPDLSGHKFGRWLVLHKDLDRLDHRRNNRNEELLIKYLLRKCNSV